MTGDLSRLPVAIRTVRENIRSAPGQTGRRVIA